MNIHTLAAAVFLLTSITGCDLFGDDDTDVDPLSAKVVVANSGNFGDQNGFLTVYDPETGATRSLANHGAFAHGVVVRGGNAYVILNTFSVGRIDIVDLETGNISGSIPDLPAPRSIAFLNDSQAMVTNLSPFGASGPEPATVSLVSLGTEPKVNGSLTVGLNPEGLVALNGKFYVANNGNLGDGTTLSVINGSTGSLAKTIALGCDGPNEVFVDADEEIVVVCEGKTVYSDDFTQILEQTNAQIVFVNPTSDAVTGRIMLDMQVGSGNFSQSAFLSEETEELYVIATVSSEVIRVDTRRHVLIDQFVVPTADDLTELTAVAYDASDEVLYLGRLAVGAGGFPDFTAAGAVVMLDREGTQVDRFTVGPAPSHIAFQTDGQ